MRATCKPYALRALLAVLLLGGAAALCILSYHADAGKAVLFCPQFRFTGLYCPGCGTMRALGSLLRGDIPGAFANNPLTALLLPLLAALGLVWLVGYVLTGRDVIWGRIPASVYYAVLGALFLFAILRNIPAPVFACLRPPV